MTALPPSPFISVSPGVFQGSLPSGEIEPSVMLACAPGESESSTSTGGYQEAPAVVPQYPTTTAGLWDLTEYEPDMDALYDAIVPPEPPPVFLRSPSQAFMRALFELTR